MSFTKYPKTDDQVVRADRVVKPIVRGRVYPFAGWGNVQPMANMPLRSRCMRLPYIYCFFVNSLSVPRFPNTISYDTY